MKTLIFSFMLILGLAAEDHGQPVNDIYSIKEPVIVEEAYISDIKPDTLKIIADTTSVSNDVKLKEEPNVKDTVAEPNNILSLLKTVYHLVWQY